MSILLQGIYAGLLLAILVGPLLVALIQASLEQGTKAGLAVGFGIWFSDLLFILSVYFGVRYVDQLVQWDGFEQILGAAGAIVLAVTGMATLLTPPPALNNPDHLLKGIKGYSSLFTKGFLINTINPFTVIFWLTIMSGVVLTKDYDGWQSTLFFGGLLGTIVFTDSVKIVLAHKIRHKLTARHLWWVRRVSGFALLIFAMVLVVRVLFFG